MKRGRKPPKGRPTKRAKVVQGTTRRQFFVARSFGNPRAVTERKYFDSERNAALAALTTSWAGGELDPATGNSLFFPVRGSDFNNIEGRKCQVLSIKIKGFFTMAAQANQTTTDDPGVIRICLVMDKQTNGAQLNAEDVINSGAASQAISMFQNPAFFGRFKVLKDKFYSLQNPAITWDGTNLEQNGLTKPFKITHKFRKPIIVHLNATNGGTPADCIDNSFHVIGGCTNNELAQSIDYKCRITFIDI